MFARDAATKENRPSVKQAMSVECFWTCRIRLRFGSDSCTRGSDLWTVPSGGPHGVRCRGQFKEFPDPLRTFPLEMSTVSWFRGISILENPIWGISEILVAGIEFAMVELVRRFRNFIDAGSPVPRPFFIYCCFLVFNFQIARTFKPNCSPFAHCCHIPNRVLRIKSDGSLK